MADSAFHRTIWLLVSTGTNDLSFMSGFPTPAASFPWLKAVLILLVAYVLFSVPLEKIFNIGPGSFHGPSIGAMGAVSLLFTFFVLLTLYVWLRERKSKKS